MGQYRIVSLLPAATEIVAECGLAHFLVGRSHDSDLPEKVTKLPALTQPRSAGSNGHSSADSSELAQLRKHLCPYDINLEALKDLRPDVVITRCVLHDSDISVEDVANTLSNYIGSHVKLLSIAPECLDEVMESIDFIAFELGAPHRGTRIITKMAKQLEATRKKLAVLNDREKPTVVVLEGLEPLKTAGSWIPEMVRLAGALDPFSAEHYHTRYLNWSQLTEIDPDMVIVMPYNQTLFESGVTLRNMHQHEQLRNLRAFKRKQVVVLDGNHFFHRPGPRLVEGFEILAEVFHPDLFRYRYMGRGWAEYF